MAVGIVHVAPLIVPGILLAAGITASGAGDRVAGIFQGRTVQTIVAATVVGAFLPVCGVTVLPLMAGLLAAGVPLAPVMAFWLASPITSPAMLSATVAVLGREFAIGKTLAAIGLGLFGGAATSLFAQREWARTALRSTGSSDPWGHLVVRPIRQRTDLIRVSGARPNAARGSGRMPGQLRGLFSSFSSRHSLPSIF